MIALVRGLGFAMGQSDAFAHLDWTPTSDERLGITDGCPFFQMGACWREVTPADPAPALARRPSRHAKSDDALASDQFHPRRLRRRCGQTKAGRVLPWG